MSRPHASIIYHQEQAMDNDPDAMPCCLNCEEEGSLLRLRCKHRWCSDCLKDMFEAATKDLGCFPPRCCHHIPLEQVRNRIPGPVATKYAVKSIEWSTKDRIYCHDVQCSSFIAPHSTHNGQAYCQKCNAVTCAKCRLQTHFGPCERKARVDNKLEELAKEKGWKRCPACETFVERRTGCRHITCQCGEDFCYLCARVLDGCQCNMEDMLEDEMQAEYADEEEDDEEWWRIMELEMLNRAGAARPT